MGEGPIGRGLAQLGRAATIAGHLAIWVGLYVASALLCLVQTGGLQLERAAAAYLCAGTTAIGVYLFDRVKVSDRFMDPADPLAKPGRYAFVGPRRMALRWSALALVLVGAAAGSLVHPLCVLLVAGACAGVHIYSGPRRAGGRRLKDLLLIKNLAVAVSITAFALALGVLGSASRSWPMALTGAALLAGRIAADAALCDIDDADADQRFGTATLPTIIGRERTWLTALAVGALLVVASWLLPAPARVRHARLLWSGLTLAGGAAVRLWNPAQLRDLIDIRFGLVGLIAAAAELGGLL